MASRLRGYWLFNSN